MWTECNSRLGGQAAGKAAVKETLLQRRACARRRARPVQRLRRVVVVHAVLEQELAREGQEDQAQDVVGDAVEVEGLRGHTRSLTACEGSLKAALAPGRLQSSWPPPSVSL